MFGSKFKVGDRVEFAEHYGTKLKGDRGTVSYLNTEFGNLLVRVEMDKGGTAECFEHRLTKLPAEVVAATLLNPMEMVVATADRIFPRRSYDTILKSLVEEMGELSTEIAIVQGTKQRAPSPDGVKGEAIDVFVVAVDMLRQAWGTELETPAFKEAVARKLAKWERK